MSIIGKITEELLDPLKVEVLDKAIKAIDQVEKIIPEKKPKQIEALAGQKVLIVKQKDYSWKNEFDVCDNNMNPIYKVKGNLLNHTLHISDLNNKEIATVKEKHLKFRKDMILNDLHDFIFKVDSKKVGVLRQKGGFKPYYYLDNGWNIKGNFMAWNFTIANGNDEVIATIKQQKLYDIYTITFNENGDELLLLMIVLALDISYASKRSEELKSKIKHDCLV